MERKQAFNPYLPSYEYIPDGEPHVFGDRLYVYGSHDRFDGSDFYVNDYVCWSAPLDDLADWHYEGVIYRASQDARNGKGDLHMCAPDVVQGSDGRYYLYYEFHRLTVTSVAVCDTPAGEYEFYGYVRRPDGKPYGETKGEVNLFDPGVLVDDDGRVYMYGLSYTSFDMSGAGVRADEGKLTVTVKVKNTGNRAGAEVVQVYVGSKGAANGDDRPVKLLKGFQRVELAPGEEKLNDVSYKAHQLYHTSGSDAETTRRKRYKEQTMKGNQAGRIYCLSGSLVTYQFGEVVGEMPEP